MILTRLCAVLVLAVLLGFGPGAARAQTDAPDPAEILTGLTELTKTVEAALEDGRVSFARIEEYRAALERRRQQLMVVVEGLKAKLAPERAELEALGPSPEEGVEEPAEIAEQRAELAQSVSELEASLKQAQSAITQIEGLSGRLIDLRRERFTRALIERQPSPVSPERIAGTWESLRTRTRVIVREVEARLNADGADSLVDRLALPLLLALAVFGLGFWIKRRLVAMIRTRATDTIGRARRARLTALVTLVRLVLPAIGVAIIIVGLRESGLLGPNGMILTEHVSTAAISLILAYAFGSAFFAPRSRGLRIVDLDDWTARGGYAWYITLALVVAGDQLLVNSGKEIRLTTDALSVINAALLIVGGVALWRLVHTVGFGRGAGDADSATDGDETSAHMRFLARAARALAMFIAVVAPLLALIGFFGASRFLFYPMVYSAAVVGAGTLIYLWVVAMSAYEPPQAEDETAAGDESAEADEEPHAEPPISVMPVVAGFLLTLLALPLLAIIWGAKATDLKSAWSMIFDGFNVGDISIAPMDFLIFAVVFAGGYFVTRIIQGILRRSVFPVLRMDSGAKAALLAGVGYVGIVISALVAISTTGLDLSNLAIVAGALSVGIGFGLQNVVNNFVSGLILLIERPIKVGDWVELNGTHGMVRRINVRSTQIQKFDRSTMFVPNADLISGTVTNMYHGAGQGQLILPIGVAYGTDAREVEKILLEVADRHPMILRDPAPFVIFRDFGASSLDFELRGIMADVNMILRVPSELRFSIYERFNEAGIEIPFAQRDITIRNLSDLRPAIAGEGDVSGD